MVHYLFQRHQSECQHDDVVLLRRFFWHLWVIVLAMVEHEMTYWVVVVVVVIVVMLIVLLMLWMISFGLDCSFHSVCHFYFSFFLVSIDFLFY